MSDVDQVKMRDVPMIDTDREAMRAEFDGFDEMTLAEFRAARAKQIDDLLDLVNRLTPPKEDV